MSSDTNWRSRWRIWSLNSFREKACGPIVGVWTGIWWALDGKSNGIWQDSVENCVGNLESTCLKWGDVVKKSRGTHWRSWTEGSSWTWSWELKEAKRSSIDTLNDIKGMSGVLDWSCKEVVSHSIEKLQCESKYQGCLGPGIGCWKKRRGQFLQHEVSGIFGSCTHRVWGGLGVLT